MFDFFQNSNELVFYDILLDKQLIDIYNICKGKILRDLSKFTDMHEVRNLELRDLYYKTLSLDKNSIQFNNNVIILRDNYNLQINIIKRAINKNKNIILRDLYFELLLTKKINIDELKESIKIFLENFSNRYSFELYIKNLTIYFKIEKKSIINIKCKY